MRKGLRGSTENLIGTARGISRNVTRWRSGEMIMRLTVVGLVQAGQAIAIWFSANAHRVRELPSLIKRGGCVIEYMSPLLCSSQQASEIARSGIGCRKVYTGPLRKEESQ
jgi:hypothetical protein